MEKIGIFGGTFDPVHNEHIKLARLAIQKLNLDRLIVVPTFMPPHKDAVPTEGVKRLEMLRLAFQNQEKVEISDYEIKKGGKSYTFETVEHFKNLYNCELFFLVGGDMLSDFKTWKNPQRILSACTLCAFGRQGFYGNTEKEREYFKNTFSKDFIRLEYEGENVSSTKIRVYSSFGLDINPYVGNAVSQYIKDNNLYQADEYVEFVKKTLTFKRLLHTANVVVTALKKAKELKLSADKVRISATLHDCAKYLSVKDFKSVNIPSDVPEPVVHAFLGAFVAEKVLGVDDPEIIDAIRYHTSGKPDMTTLGKLIFVADMIEEGRSYQGVDELRELYKGDFNACFLECLKEEFIHLQNKGQEIYSETLKAYNYYNKKI